MPTVCFSGVVRGRQGGSAAVCDPNPLRPFARYRLLFSEFSGLKSFHGFFLGVFWRRGLFVFRGVAKVAMIESRTFRLTSKVKACNASGPTPKNSLRNFGVFERGVPQRAPNLIER